MDALRGVAALGVFVDHVCTLRISPEQYPRGLSWLYTVAGLGAHGVDLFFVLSGFLITSLLVDARSKPFYYHDFYWKRALRILPVYVLCLAWVHFQVPGSGKYILLCTFFIANFANPLHVMINGPFWTLSIEEQFYLLWPFVVRRRSVAQITRVAATIAGGAILARAVAGVYGMANYNLTFFRCDGLAAGALLACWYVRREGQTNHRRENWCIAAGLLLGTFLTVVHGVNTAMGKYPLIANERQTGITLVCVSIVGLLIVHAGTRKLALLRSPVLTFFGLISYAMYMFHIYVTALYDQRYGPFKSGSMESFLIRFCATLALTVAACLVSRYAIELPFTALRKYVLHGSKTTIEPIQGERIGEDGAGDPKVGVGLRL